MVAAGIAQARTQRRPVDAVLPTDIGECLLHAILQPTQAADVDVRRLPPSTAPRGRRRARACGPAHSGAANRAGGNRPVPDRAASSALSAAARNTGSSCGVRAPKNRNSRPRPFGLVRRRRSVKARNGAAPVPVQTITTSASGSSGIRKSHRTGRRPRPSRRASGRRVVRRRRRHRTRLTVSARLLVFGRSPSRALEIE